MAAIKVHAFIGDNKGMEACDFRGDKALEGEQRTVVGEYETDDELLIAEALEIGPKINTHLAKLAPSEEVRGVLGHDAGLRFGVWDR
jgi:hypothetical protein